MANAFYQKFKQSLLTEADTNKSLNQSGTNGTFVCADRYRRLYLQPVASVLFVDGPVRSAPTWRSPHPRWSTGRSMVMM